jgi:hypothetical protein
MAAPSASRETIFLDDEITKGAAMKLAIVIMGVALLASAPSEASSSPTPVTLKAGELALSLQAAAGGMRIESLRDSDAS